MLRCNMTRWLRGQRLPTRGTMTIPTLPVFASCRDCLALFLGKRILCLSRLRDEQQGAALCNHKNSEADGSGGRVFNVVLSSSSFLMRKHCWFLQNDCLLLPARCSQHDARLAPVELSALVITEACYPRRLLIGPVIF